MSKALVIHSAWWTPLAWWAYRCDKHPLCKDCRVKPGWNSFEMEGVKEYDIARITCKSCLRKLKASAKKEKHVRL